VEGHDVAVLEDALGRRNPVHDLVVQRRADASGKTVQPLERRHGPVVAADELFGDRVEFTRGNPRPDGTAQRLDGRSENFSSLRHQLHFARRLELDHALSAPLPSASSARAVIAPTSPTAPTTTTLPSFFLYQSSTGAVCSS